MDWIEVDESLPEADRDVLNALWMGMTDPPEFHSDSEPELYTAAPESIFVNRGHPLSDEMSAVDLRCPESGRHEVTAIADAELLFEQRPYRTEVFSTSGVGDGKALAVENLSELGRVVLRELIRSYLPFLWARSPPRDDPNPVCEKSATVRIKLRTDSTRTGAYEPRYEYEEWDEEPDPDRIANELPEPDRELVELELTNAYVPDRLQSEVEVESSLTVRADGFEHEMDWWAAADISLPPEGVRMMQDVRNGMLEYRARRDEMNAVNVPCDVDLLASEADDAILLSEDPALFGVSPARGFEFGYVVFFDTDQFFENQDAPEAMPKITDLTEFERTLFAELLEAWTLFFGWESEPRDDTIPASFRVWEVERDLPESCLPILIHVGEAVPDAEQAELDFSFRCSAQFPPSAEQK